MARVTLQNVAKSFGGDRGPWAVQDFSLDIADGELVVFVGPSGCGKSTTLRMLAGLDDVTSGKILIGGKDVTALPPKDRNIAMVFQNYALFPHMSAAENIAFGLDVRGVPAGDIKQRVAESLELVRLSGLEGRRPKQLSGGQQQRVALARALVFEPKLVLMDEPLGALDKQLREHMQLEIKQLHTQLGLTVVYVTHDQSEALTMSDRVAVFNDGVIQQIDAPETLYEHPQNSFVAHFIGENNRLAGEVQTIDDRSCTVRLDDGPLVQARAVNVGGVGSRTSASIRPERLRLAGAAQGADNVFEARIRDFIYLGDHLRVRLEFAGSREFTVKVPVSQFDPRWRAGDTLAVGWSADDLRALDPVAA